MSYHHLTIGLIGGGNMSRALVRGLLRSAILRSSSASRNRMRGSASSLPL